MRKQNGTTIMEILISVIIIAIVMALLFTLLIQVRNEDKSNQIQSNFVINQSTMIKEIEEDIINYGVKRVSECDLSDANINQSVLNQTYQSDFKCIMLEYAGDYIEDNIGFVMLYNTFAKYDIENGEYKGKSDSAKWMIQYTRGRYEKRDKLGIPDKQSWRPATQFMKEYPGYVSAEEKISVYYTLASNSWNAASINIPIVNGDGEHYDINLAFTFNGTDNFKCLSKDANKVACLCDGGILCNKTYE